MSVTIYQLTASYPRRLDSSLSL